jgi:hemolysin III
VAATVPAGTVRVVRENFDHLRGEMRPSWRGRLHALGVAFFAPAGMALLVLGNGILTVLSLLVYLLGLLGAFLVSAGYHIVARTRRAQEIMQRLDHGAIYLLIAGTYTPVCLLALPRPGAWWMLGAVWVLAAVGMALKVSRRAWRTGTALYLIIGWSILTAFPSLWRQAGALVVGLLVLGGVLYTVGAVLFLSGRPRRHATHFGYHEVWHALTLAASSSHFLAIVALVVTHNPA